MADAAAAKAAVTKDLGDKLAALQAELAKAQADQKAADEAAAAKAKAAADAQAALAAAQAAAEAAAAEQKAFAEAYGPKIAGTKPGPGVPVRQSLESPGDWRRKKGVADSATPCVCIQLAQESGTQLHRLPRADRPGQAVVVVAIFVVPQRQAELDAAAQDLDLLRRAGGGVGAVEVDCSLSGSQSSSWPYFRMASNTFLQRSIVISSRVNTLSRACGGGGRRAVAKHSLQRCTPGSADRFRWLVAFEALKRGRAEPQACCVRLRRPAVKHAIILGKASFVKLFEGPKPKIREGRMDSATMRATDWRNCAACRRVACGKCCHQPDLSHV